MSKGILLTCYPPDHANLKTQIRLPESTQRWKGRRILPSCPLTSTSVLCAHTSPCPTSHTRAYTHTIIIIINHNNQNHKCNRFLTLKGLVHLYRNIGSWTILLKISETGIHFTTNNAAHPLPVVHNCVRTIYIFSKTMKIPRAGYFRYDESQNIIWNNNVSYMVNILKI